MQEHLQGVQVREIRVGIEVESVEGRCVTVSEVNYCEVPVLLTRFIAVTVRTAPQHIAWYITPKPASLAEL